MNVTDPIRRVSVVSTGQVQIRPDHEASTRRPAAWWLLASRRWTAPRPINAYVIEHRDGLVLFDTGQDRASVTDPGYFPGGMTGVLYGRLARRSVAVAAAVLVLDDVPGLGEIGDDAGGGALADARPGRDVPQPHARVVGDAQQHPGVAGQEAPVRHARTLS